MKIIAVHGFLDKLRGAELTFVNMLKHLKERGHDVDVIVFGVSDYYKDLLHKNDIKLTSLDFKEFYFKEKPFSLLNIYFRIINLMKAIYLYRRLSAKINWEHELAFIHHYSYSPLILPFLKIPTVYYCHEPPRNFYELDQSKKRRVMSILSWIKNSIPWIIEKHLDRYCIKHADLILTNSEYSRGYIQRVYGIQAVTNYLGVDQSVFRPLGIKKEDLIVSVGAIIDKKAHDFVVRSVGLIPKEKRPMLVVIGDGPQENKDKLRSLAIEEGVSLDIKSNIPADEVVECYNRAKVMAIAYIMEPSIEPEALACGTPVVAVDEGGVGEAINPEVGILTRRNEKEFSEGIMYMLDNPNVAEEMGMNGRRMVEERYSWSGCAEELNKNFELAIRQNKRRRK